MLLWELGPAKKGDFIVLLPWKVFVWSCFHSALPSDAGTAHLDRCDPSVAQRDSQLTKQQGEQWEQHPFDLHGFHLSFASPGFSKAGCEYWSVTTCT